MISIYIEKSEKQQEGEKMNGKLGNENGRIIISKEEKEKLGKIN